MKSGQGIADAASEVVAEPWVRDIASRPLAFAQVREDATLDQCIVRELGENVRVVMVASGGCTAAALATMPNVARIHLVDPNPAQIALSRLKLRWLEHRAFADRLQLLGHSAMPVRERQSQLESELKALGLSTNALGPLPLVAELGPDHAGRYEALFSKLRDALSGEAQELKSLLRLREPHEQSRRADGSSIFGRAMDASYDCVLSLPNLVALFGEGATRNRCEPFSKHFVRRTRHVLATQAAEQNPYLWQMLVGEFPNGCVYPWLSAARPNRMPRVEWTVSGMAEALMHYDQAADADFVHLSNILDWLSRRTRRLCSRGPRRRCVRAGGR